jgi:hypothetical protein
LKINIPFGGTRCHLLQGKRISQARNHRERRWQKINGLHGFISQKIELFITTTVRTSNPKDI